jgi:peptidyl-prolyl cis-trans isomerase D
MAKDKTTKIVTKKHLARLDRERRQTRWIVGIAMGVIAIVILGIAYGLLNDTLFLRWRPAITVNGETRSLHEFQSQVKVTRQQLISQYMQYSQMAQMFGMDTSETSETGQYLSQISSKLDDPTTLGQEVVDEMVNDLLIRQYAKANGITVSAEDIEKMAQEALRYYPNGTLTPTITPTEVYTPTLNATQMSLITATPTPTATETPTPAPTNTLAPTETPTPTVTPDLVSTSTPVPSFTPTATPYTLAGYQEEYKKALKNYSPMGLNDAEFRYVFFESGVYYDRVKTKVTADVAHTHEQVWARHILVTDEATAADIIRQLVKGTDFGALAAQYSIDTGTKDNGGDLGWFARGAMVSEFENAAFQLKVGQISQPVKSTYGYHIIQVLGHEDRPLTATEYSDAVTAAWNAWLETQRTNSEVVINDKWTNYVPTNPTLADAVAAEGATATSYVATYQAENSGK